MQMLKHNKNGLHGRIRGDISATLLIAQHAEFEVIDMIRHECRELIDLLVSDEEIAFALGEKDAECTGNASMVCWSLRPGERVLPLLCVRWKWALAGMDLAAAAALGGRVRCIWLIRRTRCCCRGRSAGQRVSLF